MNLKKQFLEEVKNILHNDVVKEEVLNLFKPIIHALLTSIYPYIYLSLIFVVISFLLILGNFILMLRFFYIKHKSV
jgi:hypothetical protein